ncbi:MAG: ATP-binding protein [Calditrichaceae bacterium]
MKIAIASGKGGTGKTTLSTNLAAYLAESHEVLLVDLDVEEPNSGLFIKGNLVYKEDKFKMVPQWDQNKCGLTGICQQVCNFHAILKLGKQVMIFPELCHSCYACSELCPSEALPMVPEKRGVLCEYKNNNLTFIESRLDIGQEQAAPLIAQTKEYIEKHLNNLGIQIYDSPPGTSCPVIEAVKDVDYVILVTEPTPFGLHDLKLAVETIRKLEKPFGVVINKFGIGNDDVIDYCRDEQIKIVAKIPNDRKIAEAYSKGSLIYRENPPIQSQFEMIWHEVSEGVSV